MSAERGSDDRVSPVGSELRLGVPRTARPPGEHRLAQFPERGRAAVAAVVGADRGVGRPEVDRCCNCWSASVSPSVPAVSVDHESTARWTSASASSESSLPPVATASATLVPPESASSPLAGSESGRVDLLAVHVDVGRPVEGERRHLAVELVLVHPPVHRSPSRRPVRVVPARRGTDRPRDHERVGGGTVVRTPVDREGVRVGRLALPVRPRAGAGAGPGEEPGPGRRSDPQPPQDAPTVRSRRRGDAPDRVPCRPPPSRRADPGVRERLGSGPGMVPALALRIFPLSAVSPLIANQITTAYRPRYHTRSRSSIEQAGLWIAVRLTITATVR